MCCFSGKVDHVAGTRIFARHDNITGNQYLAYSMNYQAAESVAMILPLPVKAGVADPVLFISLREYPHFFRDIAAGFASRGSGGAGGAPPAGAASAAPLPVVSVGDFIASYVPSMGDFDRLDRRFTIPWQTWNALPQYRDFGFAVFKLKAAPRGLSVHPMALSFTTRYSNTLYFPTVHIHDGRVHPREEFDHELYMQFADEKPDVARAMEASPRADYFLHVERTRSLVDGKRPFYRQKLRGVLPNRDTFFPNP